MTVDGIPTSVAILFAALLATAGWLYTARRNRILSRRQHTFNALLSASFNLQYQDGLCAIRPFIREGRDIPDLGHDDNKDVKDKIVFLLNHYEFLAAAIRNGDIAEELLRDSERSTIMLIFEKADSFIWSLRNNRNRNSIYEHLEWLHHRWSVKRPPVLERIVEWGFGRPLYHPHHQWVAVGGAVAVALLFVLAWVHIPLQQ